MNTVYLACIIIGIALPLLSLVVDAFDGFVDFVSFDLFQLDIGDISIDFLPLSINSLCLWSLMFGGCGMIFSDKWSQTKVIVIGLIAGYICAVLLQSMIKKLKKVKNYADEAAQMLFKKGFVANKIPKGGVGAVSVETDNGSTITYPAKSESGEEIIQDKEIEIVEFRDSYAIVRSKTYLEDKYK